MLEMKLTTSRLVDYVVQLIVHTLEWLVREAIVSLRGQCVLSVRYQWMNMHTRMNSAFSLVEKDCMLFRRLELGWKIERKWCLNHLICIMGSSCCESVGVHRLLVNADYLQGTVIAD